MFEPRPVTYQTYRCVGGGPCEGQRVSIPADAVTYDVTKPDAIFARALREDPILLPHHSPRVVHGTYRRQLTTDGIALVWAGWDEEG